MDAPGIRLRPVEVERTPTLAEFAETRLERRANGTPPLRPSTLRAYTSSLSRHVLPTLGDIEITAITRTTVRSWYDRQMRQVPPRARSKAYAVLRAAMNPAVADELIAASPVHIRGAGVARRSHTVDPIEPDLAVLLDALPERFRLMVLLSTWCALRYGEVAELRRKDVHLKAHVLSITRTVTFLPGGSVVGPPKTRAGIRRVAIPPHILGDVEKHRLCRSDRPGRLRGGADHEPGLVSRPTDGPQIGRGAAPRRVHPVRDALLSGLAVDGTVALVVLTLTAVHSRWSAWLTWLLIGCLAKTLIQVTAAVVRSRRTPEPPTPDGPVDARRGRCEGRLRYDDDGRSYADSRDSLL